MGLARKPWEQIESSSLFSDLREKALAVKEVLFTAVVFGLTMNILSDFLLSLPLLMSDPLILWRVTLAGLSIVVTILILYRLTSLYFSKESQDEQELLLTIVWDKRTGGIAQSDLGYMPHLLANRVWTELSDELRSELSGVITGGLEELEVSPLPLQMVERIIFGVLALVENTVSQHTREVNQFVSRNNPLFTEDFRETALKLPGDWHLSVRQASTNSALFVFSWFHLAKFRVEMQVNRTKTGILMDYPNADTSLIDPFYFPEFVKDIEREVEALHKKMPEVFPMAEKLKSSEPKLTPTSFVRADFKLRISAHFSPVRLAFGSQEQQELLASVKQLMKHLQLSLDWDTYRSLKAVPDWQSLISSNPRTPPDYPLYRGQVDLGW